MRHKWDKRKYSGKFSSFEMDATCIKCGCEREKLTFGYKYEKDGNITYTAPECVLIKQ